MKPCEFCIAKALTYEAKVRGARGLCSTPIPDPRNPLWFLTRLFVVGYGEQWDQRLEGPHWRATVSCPSPLKCVCDRPAPPGKQVWGNSSDEAWPHKCPLCGYHAAVVADDGSVVKCRAYGCARFCPPPFVTVEGFDAWRKTMRGARC